MRAALGFSGLSFLLVTGIAAARPTVPNPVGFRILTSVDEARNQPVLQVAVWYPSAVAGQAAALSARDYLALTLVEREASAPAPADVDAAMAAFVRMFGPGEPASAARRWLNAPGRACRDSAPAAGPYPLVLIAQGNGQSAFDQAPLAERLAARGYVVATTPSPMRLDGPMQSAAEIGARAQVQAQDLAFAAAQAAAALPIDPERMAVIGHSFGARSALLLALHDPRVRALVSLDGGIGTALGTQEMERAPWFVAGGTNAAILHFYEELDPFMAPEFTWLRAVARGGLELVPTADMHHHHFTHLGFAAAAEPELARATGAGAQLATSLDAVVTRLLDFLDARLSVR